MWVDKHVDPMSRVYTHGFKRHMGRSGVGYVFEVLSWGELLLDLRKYWGGVGFNPLSISSKLPIPLFNTKNLSFW